MTDIAGIDGLPFSNTGIFLGVVHALLQKRGLGRIVEGSPPRLMRDYNQLIDAYNRGPGI